MVSMFPSIHLDCTRKPLCLGRVIICFSGRLWLFLYLEPQTSLSPHLWLPVAGYPPGVHSGRQALPQLPARHLSCLLRHLRPHRTVRPGQRGGGSADEAPGGEQQGGQGGC